MEKAGQDDYIAGFETDLIIQVQRERIRLPAFSITLSMIAAISKG